MYRLRIWALVKLHSGEKPNTVHLIAVWKMYPLRLSSRGNAQWRKAKHCALDFSLENIILAYELEMHSGEKPKYKNDYMMMTF